MASLITRAARRRGRFHALTVARIQRLTDDAVAVSFAIPDELAAEFVFEPGQHLTRRDGGQAEAAEVELDQAEAGLLHGPGHLRSRVAAERAGEDAQVGVHSAASGARAAHRSTG